jgi:glycosyltransferase involved in cell wall biosynthesis
LVYNLGRITIGARTTISQRVHLCAGTHDYKNPALPLVKPPIKIGDQVWVCADAFIGPSVSIGARAIVAAASVVISESDNGQSDAFNKGFRLAKGEYLTWLNSDDVFCQNAMARVVQYIKQTRQPWYAANMLYINSKSEILRCCQSGSFEKWALSFGILNVFGPSTIFHRDLYAQLGGFRQDFHFCMDTEYWWRIASRGIRYERIPIYLWALRLHEDAKTAASVKGGEDARPPGMRKENELNREMYFPMVSTRKKKFGIIFARAYRVLNLSYIKSIFSTYRYKGNLVADVTRVH